jgi:hypothetical protein
VVRGARIRYNKGVLTGRWRNVRWDGVLGRIAKEPQNNGRELDGREVCSSGGARRKLRSREVVTVIEYRSRGG